MRFVFPAVLIAAVLAGLAALVMHRPDLKAIPAPPSAPVQAPPPAGMMALAPRAPAPPPASTARVASPPTSSPHTATASSAGGGAKNQAGGSSGQTMPGMALGHDQPTAALTVVVGNIEEGRKVFRKCQACHSLQAGKELVGPSL